MVSLDEIESKLLQKPSGDAPEEPLERTQSVYKPLDTFKLEKGRSYQQQYADTYFLRLTKIKPAVEQVAEAAWEGTVIGGETAKKADRVLDVRQGELCWVAGTVYVDMSLKPNILDDVSKDRWISAPTSVAKYFGDDDRDAIMLEDDSGRIRLTGDLLKSVMLVTGCIIAVVGTENANGDFEVIDVKFADLPPQPDRWALSEPPKNGANGAAKGKKTVKSEDVEMTDAMSAASGGKIAIVSGLNFAGDDTSYALELNLLLEYLLGEALEPSTQAELSHISRLIIAGNSIAAANPRFGESAGEKKAAQKKYGYDASSYNPLPSQLLDEFLAELLPSMPVTLLPGEHDPANASFPQQPIHTAMFPRSRAFAAAPNSKEKGWLDPVTNPWEGEVDGWRILGTGGQNVDDLFKYIDSDDRIAMMEVMCRWRCSAPTAPDTLWSYPFQDDDPFVMNNCPHVYFVGCQPTFGTRVITGPEGQAVRLIAVPSFSESKEIVLVDTETLEVSRVKISAS
ncbi:dna polymerase delta small subunit [Diaporthe amygdali]|uniref:dna polymerase delta small subunit n=1 Tax=Phomopsis amygdali TaxID=1214568 RepID=UPI0022FDF933|nr:dna polymerase delta small subunit [Diaporthe amygdali]KAJ0117185.1 dna polymerase delta small subunit [Diaporthe amygdali]